MHLLRRLNTLHFCATALAVRLAATNTLIMRKTLKMTVYTCKIIPCKTCHKFKRLSEALYFFSLLIFMNSLPIILSLTKRRDISKTATELKLPN